MAVATDSSPEAGAVVTAPRPRSMVAETGRRQERARIRAFGAAEGGAAARPGARESALAAAGFWRDADGEWRLASAQSESELDVAWEVDYDFPEVPVAGLASSRWRTKQVQRWRYEEGILIKEARAQ